MWTYILVIAGLIFVTVALYMIRGLSRIEFMQHICKDKKWLSVILSIVGFAVVFTVFVLWLDYINTILIFIHLCVFWMLVDFIMFIRKRITGKEAKRWMATLVAFSISTVYILTGVYHAYNVDETTYQVKTDKNVGDIRVVLLADAHIGALFDGDGFEKHVDRIQKANPDVVIIAGDFVDDDSKREDVEKCCKALGKLECKYGVYYSPGNHDRGYYSYRDFTYNDLKIEFEKNGINVLEDECVLIDDRFYILGRKDKSEFAIGSERKSMEEMVSGLDESKYMIVVDHQPNDYKAEYESGVDLVLSGHTHGGQLFPGAYTGEWTGLNELSYGMENIKDTYFVVTSGIADWRLKFKTGCKSEYVIVDVKEE